MRKEEKQKAREKGKDIPAECRVPESSKKISIRKPSSMNNAKK